MPRKRLLAGLAVAAGLGVGGVAGVILGVPTVSAAQTTTTVPSDPAPSTEDPAPPATPEAPGTPGGRQHDDAGCPNMGDEPGVEGSSTGVTAADAVLRRGPGGRGGGATSL